MIDRSSGRLMSVVILGSSLLLAACNGADTSEFDLSPEQEVPPVASAATGEGTAELDGDVLTVNGTFSGLESDLMDVQGSPAHVHRAPAGENGPIVFNLDVTPNADNRSGTFTGSATLTEEDQELFRENGLYVNIHTVENPAGELRGQM